MMAVALISGAESAGRQRGSRCRRRHRDFHRQYAGRRQAEKAYANRSDGLAVEPLDTGACSSPTPPEIGEPERLGLLL